MQRQQEATEDCVIDIVDDDAGLRVALEDLLASMGWRVRSHASVEALLASERPDAPGCLILDVRMPGLSGLTFQRQMAQHGLHMPVIFMTGHGDIEMGVSAMKHGAIEFLTKPFRDQDLLDAIERGLQLDLARWRQRGETRALQQRYATLTPGEQMVMQGVAQGLLNKQIAHEAGLSEITIKVRRAQVMKKMQARTLADLIRMADRLAGEAAPGAGV